MKYVQEEIIQRKMSGGNFHRGRGDYCLEGNYLGVVFRGSCLRGNYSRVIVRGGEGTKV